MAYEVMDKSIDDDSDSDLEEAAHLSRQEKMREDAAVRDAEKKFAQMDMNQPAPSKPPRPGNIPMPPRPAKPADDDTDTDYESDDDDDPFADKHAAPKTPDPNSRTGYTWKEV